VSACKQDVPLGRNNADVGGNPDGGSDAAADVRSVFDGAIDEPHRDVSAPPDAPAPSDMVAVPDAPIEMVPSPTDGPLDGAGPVLGSLTCPQCPAGMKVCRSSCGPSGFSYVCELCYPTIPSLGCNRPGCNPCDSYLPHATAAPACDSNGACAIGACDPGWADCDGNRDNGCEANLLEAGSCGQCGTTCPAGQFCTPAGCQSSCQPPLTMCPDGRCVDLSKDYSHCGGCATPCHGRQQCRAGTCQDPPAPPPPPCTMCGGVCRDLSTDYYNCGACGNACGSGGSGAEPKGGGVSVCLEGKCVRRCGPGFVACGSLCVALATDRDHCGVCGRVCAATDLCVSGACVPAASLRLATGLTDPMDLAVDADAVYWSDIGDGTINRVPRAGGTVTTLVRNQAKPARIALDATHVYWTNALGASVMRAPKSGGMPELLSSAIQPTDLAVVGDSVYWVNNLSQSAYELRKGPRSGGTSTQVIRCLNEREGFDPAAAAVTLLVEEGTWLFLGCPQPSFQFAVARIDTSNGDAITSVLGRRLYRRPDVAVSGPSFFNLAGGTAVTLYDFDKTSGKEGSSYTLRGISVPAFSPGQLVASACGLYWWDEGSTIAAKDDLVSYVPFGAPISIFKGAVDPRRTVVDGGTIFWTEKGAVAKMPVP
jgi:hypothetical protein